MRAWEDFLVELEKPFGKETVDKWLRTLKILRFDACNLYLQPCDSFQAMWVQEHIAPLAKKQFCNNNGHRINLHIEALEPKGDKTPAPSVMAGELKFENDITYPHCSLEQFVASKENSMTYKIFCNLLGFDPEAGVNKDLPKDKLNPIYIYGPGGTGKTHLLMAAATQLSQHGQKVFFVKADTFTQHVVNAIRSSKMQSFRQAYRTADVLIIDDVDVFGRKAATQEELFHTFNTLHTSGKQIILSSRTNPRLLEYIEERLISRFEWGITLPLEKSFDQSVLTSILDKRLSLFRMEITDSLRDFIINHFKTPSSLSKALEYLQSHFQSSYQSLELSHVEPILQRLCDQEQKLQLNPERILDAVAVAFGIRKEDIISKSQTRDSVLPRKIAMYLLRRELKLPYMKIGSLFERDHSTVMSSIKQVKKDLDNNNPDITYYFSQFKF